MRVKYVGHPDGCDLVREDGGWQSVSHGEVIEVSAEHGAALLEQPTNWKKDGAGAKKPASKGGAKKPAVKDSEPEAPEEQTAPGADAAAAQTTTP